MLQSIHLNTLTRNMEVRRYSLSTIKTYNGCLKLYMDYTNERNLDPELESTTREFLHYVVKTKKYSRSTQDQFINAIKYYWEHYLGKDKIYFIDIERPRRARVLPQILSKEEVKAILINTNNLKHRAILSLMYAQGLRIGEVLSLTIQDVNSRLMVLHIRKGKGCKDRNVPLSEKILLLLRDYYKAYRPKHFLFEGQKGGQYSKSSVRQFLQRVCIKAGIRRHVKTHMLRHSYATHLLEAGTDIPFIKSLPAHNNIKTTEIYTHVTSKHLANITSPFDTL
jgi:site-specific recombinase XerD